MMPNILSISAIMPGEVALIWLG